MPAQMKFERLTVPDLSLPDLVAFNRRVHERVDPWFERRWVRRGAWIGVVGFLFFAAVWLFSATGDRRVRLGRGQVLLQTRRHRLSRAGRRGWGLCHEDRDRGRPGARRFD